MSDKRARASRYAQAVLQAMLERWQGSLDSVSGAIAGDQKLMAQLNDKSKSSAEKMTLLTGLLPADAPVEIRNLFNLLVQEGDLSLLPEISAALVESASGKHAPVKAEVSSAFELDAAEQEKIRASLIAEYGEGLIFTFRVDPALLGGLRVRVGDRLIDMSVASRLAKLRESIASVVQ